MNVSWSEQLANRVSEGLEFYWEKVTETPVWLLFGLTFDDNGLDIVDEDWKYLFICDSARADLFAETNWIPGDFDTVWSRGGETAEFIKNNFTDESYDDIVYVTASPRADWYIEPRVHEYIPVWKIEWDENTGIVPADTMREFCIDAIRQYPDKRIIFHFNQPHLSIYSNEIEGISDTETDKPDKSVLRKLFEGSISKSFARRSAWSLFHDGVIDKETIWDIQRQKLETALEEIEEVLPYCDDTTVITSDHGNCYGERYHKLIPLRIIEHPRRMNHKHLRSVPWLEVDRRSYPPRDPIEYNPEIPEWASNDLSDVTKNRLRDLGYV